LGGGKRGEEVCGLFRRKSETLNVELKYGIGCDYKHGLNKLNLYCLPERRIPWAQSE
jgi:hypothetical protein